MLLLARKPTINMGKIKKDDFKYGQVNFDEDFQIFKGTSKKRLLT